MSSFSILMMTLLIGSGAGAALPPDGALVQVKSVAEVDGSKAEITLGDLIVSHGVSASAMASLKSVRLADTPNPGESRTFTALGLEQVFRPHLRTIESRTGEKIALRVPSRVTVVRKSFQLKKDDLVKVIKEQLREFCTDCAFEVSNLSLPAVVPSVPAGSSWVLRMRGDIPKGSFSAPIEIANEDGSKRTYWISGVVAVTRKVPVATRALAAGERVRSEDFTMQTKDVTFATDVAAAESEIAASVTARPMSAGQVIWRSGLRRDLAVKQGDGVKVMAGADGWQVMIDGVAQNSAYIGDSVKVKIPRTQKMVSGLLTDKGIVEVR